MLDELFDLLIGVSKRINDDDLKEMVTKFCTFGHTVFTELVKAGFTEEQAIRILVAQVGKK